MRQTPRRGCVAQAPCTRGSPWPPRSSHGAGRSRTATRAPRARRGRPLARLPRSAAGGGLRRSVGERERGGCVELRVIKAPYTQSEEDSLHSKRGGQPALKARRIADGEGRHLQRRCHFGLGRGVPAPPTPERKTLRRRWGARRGGLSLRAAACGGPSPPRGCAQTTGAGAGEGGGGRTARARRRRGASGRGERARG